MAEEKTKETKVEKKQKVEEKKRKIVKKSYSDNFTR